MMVDFNDGPPITRGALALRVYQRTAIASISNLAFLGRRPACTVDRAG
jgi:hypothetical protein